ncbi:MAG: hypothetical protein KGJ86_08645, partial [Chloroflexota bacterium]|nr:hypothetical protein [Chloroflexota bacterium]
LNQKFDALAEQFRFRCTIHKVKISHPLQRCRSLRHCPLDPEPIGVVPAPSCRPMEVAAGTVAAALARRLSAMNAGQRAG